MNSVSLKYLLKSKSFKFMKDRKDKSHKITTYNYNNTSIYYRTSTSDMIMIYEILLKKNYDAEYWLPQEIEPQLILDIGGNIGITSIYLANRFPDAQIYTFEPLPQNFEILKKNTSPYKNIHIFNVGLGKEDGTFDIYMSSDSENFGGASLNSNFEVENTNKVTCKIRNINNMLFELNINKIDLIKIDTEGAEFDILKSLQKDKLEQVQWITGELHGCKDFELLSYLENLNFEIGMKKSLNSKLFMFNCAKQKILNKLTKSDRRYFETI